MADSAEHVTLWCILVPCLGKEDNLREALLDLAKTVKEVESECLEYQVIESNRTPDGMPKTSFYLLERWTNESALEKHSKRDWLAIHHNLLSTEQLLVGEESIQPVKIIGGFGARSIVEAANSSN
ncbi:uncharacterized protein K460DRAFT_396622 [Cucurbitaria berberidis CBS 394.84]|uniref:ABM domain-containing protein n=1 Tax=Cucurbitaria berberidis CBS 394.84 TaxID=1168544 RepID=A0A9P4GD31_9PLEO|nr:uncharacterized protein K460DRAFT_396622 [Cucurbitaria berberidis CBS 394.84]KAF1843284.1 hypothetical protein K460DRAFT_396622 [Cucurbitaria berberidis CBS 394.84]